MCELYPIPEDMRALIADARARLPILEEPSADLLDEATALFRALVLEGSSCC